MNCILRYPGGKSRMLKALTPLLDGLMAGESSYGEPFVGGGSVALHVARHTEANLFLNDKDPMVSGFWSAICGSQSQIDELVNRIDVSPTVALWDEVKHFKPKTCVDVAFKTVFLNRTSFNGMLAGSSPIGGRNQKGKPGAQRVWLIGCQYNVPELQRLIKAYHSLLAGRTTVSNMDGRLFLLQHAAVPHFVDPPYFIEGTSKHRIKGLYGVDMTRQEHQELAATLAVTRKWLMTYDFEDQVAKELYYGIKTEVMHVKYSSTTRSTGKWKKDAELVAYHGFKV